MKNELPGIRGNVRLDHKWIVIGTNKEVLGDVPWELYP